MNKRKIYKNEKKGKEIRDSYDAVLKQWDCSIKELDIKGKYGTTHIIELGSEQNEPLILFHGVGDDAALMWVYNAKELGEHFHVYAVDTIGGPGKSVPGDGYDESFEDEVWIDEILNSLGIESAFMAGVSNGAYLVQMYAIERPERVKKGISMAGTPPICASGNAKEQAMKTMMKVFLPEALLPTDKNVKKLIRKMTGSNYHAFTDNEVVYRHFKQLMTGFNRAAMLNHKVKAYSEELVIPISEKMMYIAGRKDPFMMAGGEQVLQHLFEKYSINLVWLEDAGHGINHEKSKEVNELMINHFS